MDLRGRLRQPQPALPAGEPASPDNAWLEARLAEMAERLQSSLAEINPDKATAHLNRRLDAIEERFNEALGKVVQRSDLDGLKLIEAHVIELAAHVEHTRGRLDRIDAIGGQMPTDSFRFATMGGAKALGRAHELGAIEKGRIADMTGYDLHSLPFTPLNNPVHQLVCAACRHEVDFVMVDGETILQHGKLTRVDEDKLIDEIAEAHARIEPLITEFEQRRRAAAPGL